MKTIDGTTKLRAHAAWPVLLGALSTPLLVDCGAAKELEQAASGCDEFQQGPEATLRLDVDTHVKTFVSASSELKVVVGQIKVDVKSACVDICNRLGVADTWSTYGDDDDSISNDEGTGACDKAAAEIDAIMRENKGVAKFALTVTSPKCALDVEAQASCEANCKVDAACKPGEIDVVTRCDPAQLSVQCGGTCNFNAVCQGTASVAVQCHGECDAMCQGQCSGTCVGETGVMTENDANCRGKCKGMCKGTCEGDCRITEQGGIACGASATCKGGCTGTYTAPKCETELRALPPQCNVDASCQASCSSRARCNVHCEKPRVILIADTSASPKIAALKAAIEVNFPKLVLAARTQGPLVLHAVEEMAVSGTAVVRSSATLSGKAVACAAVAAQAAVSASATISVSVQASAKVESSCSSNQS
jgi:hypothetical protein